MYTYTRILIYFRWSLVATYAFRFVGRYNLYNFLAAGAVSLFVFVVAAVQNVFGFHLNVCHPTM